jgi:hypothetical protein
MKIQYRIINTGKGILNINSANLQEIIQSNGAVKAETLILTGLPIFVNEAAAVSLATGDVYMTATGELRIKL